MIEQSVGNLSGGNPQKVVFARWFLASPAVFVFDEPTQNVDVGTKLALSCLIRALAEGGAGVFAAFFEHLAALSSSAHLVQIFDSTIACTHVSASLADHLTG